MARNILVVIDMQNDFISGALGTTEAVAIVPKVVAEIEKDYDAVFYTQDTHFDDYLETEEGRNLPVLHCQEGTSGWRVEPRVAAALAKKKAKGFTKPSFGSLDLAKELVKENVESLTFVGLCTDICVISNALLAKANLPDVPIRVLAGACAGVTPESHETALRAMMSCQVAVVRD